MSLHLFRNTSYQHFINIQSDSTETPLEGKIPLQTEQINGDGWRHVWCQDPSARDPSHLCTNIGRIEGPINITTLISEMAKHASLDMSQFLRTVTH